MFVPNSRARVGSPSITGAANPNPLAGIESHRTASALPLNQKLRFQFPTTSSSNLKDPAYFPHFLALRHNESRGPNQGRQAGNSLSRMKIIVIASDTLRGWTPECDGGAVIFNFLEMK